ncbi:pirin family protein [Ornithinimicrobium sufpigmenti]|uniref:pirin family protein n=1 Tax=Ornithinimicrobium sufpigmenti TaxID=2508882 RepID=UPI001035E77F|nr:MULTISPECIES: pirin family protein [unclassified Ornithinimicrobium]
MTNLDPHPVAVECGDEAQGHGTTVIEPREVPLGGPRAMTVRRSLPARGRTTIGAWCFLDHYGPDEIAETGGMVVPPHPHTSLQTVSWLFTGTVEHRDSTGVRAHVVPGELNLMTAGHGICHSEVSVREEGAPGILHGVQLWTVLPAEHADVPAHFQHFEPEPHAADGVRASVFLGTVAVGGTELSSPVPTYSPLLGAELVLEPGATAYLGVDPAFEHGVLLDQGQVHASGTPLQPHQLSHHPPGPGTLELLAGPEGARVILIGGTPFEEQIVMWWNFIGRSHEEVVQARERWNAERGQDPDGRFGAFDYPGGEWLPAPTLPRVRLRPRG